MHAECYSFGYYAISLDKHEKTPQLSRDIAHYFSFMQMGHFQSQNPVCSRWTLTVWGDAWLCHKLEIVGKEKKRLKLSLQRVSFGWNSVFIKGDL